MGEHEGPPPPLAGANKEHAGDADEFTSEKDPGPHRFIIHTVSIAGNRPPKLRIYSLELANGR